MNYRLVFGLVAAVGLLSLMPHGKPGPWASGGEGARPRNVAVRAGEALVTSTASNSVIHVEADGTCHPVDVGASSWGVCFVDDTHALVTHPFANFCSILEKTGGGFTKIGSFPVPYYSTEIISGGSDVVYIANRGMGSIASGAEAWQHEVYEATRDPGSGVWSADLLNPFVAEHQPSALALSPDGTVLFVGHTAGALGADGVSGAIPFVFGTPDGTLDNRADAIFDGGSIVSFEVASRTPQYRIAVGSPVRDVEVWPPADAPAASRPNGGWYRLYFTHVGDGAQSEHPDFGGRAIANVVSSVKMNAANQPQLREDFVFRHDPEFEPEDASGTLPAVLPEQLAFRWIQNGNKYAWEVWVTNSASGTVSRTDLESKKGNLASDFGRILTSGSVDIRATPGNGNQKLLVVTGRPSPDVLQTAVVDNQGGQDAMTVEFDLVDAPDHVYVGDPSGNFFTSNPRGIAWDRGSRILVVNQLDHTLAVLDPGTPPFTPNRFPVGSGGVSEHEKNFFTFGQGFDFRDSPSSGPVEDLMVNTLSCQTCHVGGHLDGKLRTTFRNVSTLANLRPGQNPEKVVTVPSVFDTGETEWLFFEGLITSRDTPEFSGIPVPDSNCDYCLVGEAGFFTSTFNFTTGTFTPLSPHAPTGLSDTQQWGRYWFQKLNCTRCHGGPVPAPFDRTDVVEDEFVFPKGPMPAGLLTSNRFLHDATQIFITKGDDPRGKASFRNMTDVGTRPVDGSGQPLDGGFLPGINTPALAGAWDNAPYFHDGRHRTLEEVLANTWLDPGDGYRAAPLYLDGAGAVFSPADNAYNSLTFIPILRDTLPPNNESTDLHPFGTHAASNPEPGVRVDAGTYLASIATGTGVTAKEAVLDFLSAVSSQTDLCPEIEVTDFNAAFPGGCASTRLSWNTTVPVACDVAISTPGFPPEQGSTPEGESHILYLPTVAGKTYSVTISMDKGTSPSANSPVCTEVDIDDTHSFTTLTCPPPCTPGRDCDEIEGVEMRMARVTALLGAVPNPIPSSTRIAFAMAEPGPVRIEVFDVQGRVVRTLAREDYPPGVHHVTWRGETDQGARTSAGLYYLVFRAGTVVERRSLVLLKQ